MNPDLRAVFYLIAAVAFIVGLKRLSGPRTARSGNAIGAAGMLLAIVVAVLDGQFTDDVKVKWLVIGGGIAVGAAIGAVAALKVKMTAMPQMVAIFNGFGGAASALVAGAAYLDAGAPGIPGDTMLTILLSVAIGAVTFTGSLIAFAKLQGILRGSPITWPAQRPINLLIALGLLGIGAWAVVSQGSLPFWVGGGVALVLGILLVVPIGVDIEKYNPDLDVNDVRQRYDLEDKATTILFVGRLCAEKGVEYLIKAANILVNELGDRSLRFLLVGPIEQFGAGVQTHSSYLAKITKLIKDFGLQKDIQLTGTVPLDDLRKLYAACDIVVVPSVVDLDPQVQIEAMASGKPVIGTRVGTMPRRIKHGQSGFIIDPADEKQLADGIKYLIDNPEELKKMGAFARKLASEEFSSDKMAERMLQVFEDVAISPR